MERKRAAAGRMRTGSCPPYRDRFEDAWHLILWALCAAAVLGEGAADKQVQEYGSSESSFLVHVELFNLNGERNTKEVYVCFTQSVFRTRAARVTQQSQIASHGRT